MIPFSQRITILTSLHGIIGKSFGQTIVKQHEKFIPILKCKLSIEIILEKIEKNKYCSVDEIINEYKIFFIEILKIIGKDTVLGLATQDLRKQIFNVLQPKQKKYEDIGSIASKLDSLLNNAPDNKEEMDEKLVDKVGIQPKIYPRVKKFEQIQREDVQQITKILQSVKSDEEASEIMNIVKVFDPEFVKFNRMRFFTDELSPFTISLLRSYFFDDRDD